MEGYSPVLRSLLASENPTGGWPGVGAGSPGSTLLQDPEDPVWLINTRGVVYPTELERSVGSLPGSDSSGDDWNDAACSIFIDRLVRGDLDFGILWLCDPDLTQHQAGLGAPQSLEAILRNDDRLGRIRSKLPGDALLIVASDHGFSTVEGEPLGEGWAAGPGLDPAKTALVPNGSLLSAEDVDVGARFLLGEVKGGWAACLPNAPSPPVRFRTTMPRSDTPAERQIFITVMRGMIRRMRMAQPVVCSAQGRLPPTALSVRSI